MLVRLTRVYDNVSIIPTLGKGLRGADNNFDKTIEHHQQRGSLVDVFHPWLRGEKAGSKIAARALATYLIPRCVGRGIRLGSESSSGGGGWKSRNLEIWGPGNLEIWGPQHHKKKISKSKSVLPKMSARSGLVGKKHPGPIWDHLRPFFP